MCFFNLCKRKNMFVQLQRKTYMKYARLWYFTKVILVILGYFWNILFEGFAHCLTLFCKLCLCENFNLPVPFIENIFQNFMFIKSSMLVISYFNVCFPCDIREEAYKETVRPQDTSLLLKRFVGLDKLHF